MFPPKLRPGSGVRIIAPSCSMSSLPWMTKESIAIAEERLTSLGLRVSYGKHIREIDDLESSRIASRLEDLHDAFADPDIHLILPVRGGFSANQLLKFLDYDLINKNLKILCGFSDITALGTAITVKTGLTTYSGPNFNTFACKKGFDYSLESFRTCLMSDEPMNIVPSKKWSNDRWGTDQEKREFIDNEGCWIFREGTAKGTLLGGNLCTLNLLQGTEFMPDLNGSVLFLEDDYESLPRAFDRNLQSLLHLPSTKGIRGLVIGRFEKASQISRELLRQIVETKEELNGIPVIANADFGHTQPLITFPIGGQVTLDVTHDRAQILITAH